MGRVPDQVLNDVRGRLAALVGINVAAIGRGADGT